MNWVTVEPVPADRRTGILADIPVVVVEREPGDGRQWVHLPATCDEQAMTLREYGRKVAAEQGAVWVEPPPDHEPDGKEVRNRHLSRLPVLTIPAKGVQS